MIPLFIVVGTAMFVYGLTSLVFVKDEVKRKNRKKIIIWGFVLLFAVVTFWAIISLNQNTTGGW
ncbi:MAG: putative membrane protein YeiB [Candidatus Paceibacteria bacterium]|jgi:uncharacterized membrane protein YeiB